MGGCEPPCGCWDLNSWPSEEQSVLLPAEPSHQPLFLAFLSLHLWSFPLVWKDLTRDDWLVNLTSSRMQTSGSSCEELPWLDYLKQEDPCQMRVAPSRGHPHKRMWKKKTFLLAHTYLYFLWVQHSPLISEPTSFDYCHRKCWYFSRSPVPD